VRFPGAGRVLQTIHTRLCGGYTAAKPAHRKGLTWQWTSTEQRAFECLKGRLLEAPILAYPDPNLEYILDTDASDQNVGAVLSQVQEGREVVVAYYSKSLSLTA